MINGIIELERRFGANHYAPLPVVITRGKGIYLWDQSGKRYIDMMSAYSAVSQGHCHPRIVAALAQQAQQLGVISRAYYSDKLAPFQEKLCQLTGFDKVLPMNSGAEAVETAVKAARKWATLVKGIPEDQNEIIVCNGNFHGRTVGIISFSQEPQYRAGFGPFLPGFVNIPFNNAKALANAITPHTAAFLVEPIQGEGGVIVPDEGYLKACEKICRDNNVLLICDEIQTGLGRTGKWLASQHDDVQPDGVILGKALGGGLLPVSAFLARSEVMEVFTPGDHGSTFGGNPLAAAVGFEALSVLADEKLIENAEIIGKYLLKQLGQFNFPFIKSIRGRGLLIGIEIDPKFATAREICFALMDNGILSKDTHGTVVRLAPPLVINRQEIDEVLKIIEHTLSAVYRRKQGCSV